MPNKKYRPDFDIVIPGKTFKRHFNSDVKLGEQGEKYVNLTFGSHVKSEVKTDFKTTKTLNLAVEIAYDKKPSGLSLSKSDIYQFVIAGTYGKNVIITISTSLLRKTVKKLMRCPRYIRYCGDGNKSKVVLVPITYLIKSLML
jgi:hypothetical protein